MLTYLHNYKREHIFFLVLEDTKPEIQYVVPPIVIKKMFNGLEYSLDIYKKFDEKLLLLDSALEAMDGNIILKVSCMLFNITMMYHVVFVGNSIFKINT